MTKKKPLEGGLKNTLTIAQDTQTLLTHIREHPEDILKQLSATSECPALEGHKQSLPHHARGAMCQPVTFCAPLPFQEACYVLNNTHQVS